MIDAKTAYKIALSEVVRLSSDVERDALKETYELIKEAAKNGKFNLTVYRKLSRFELYSLVYSGFRIEFGDICSYVSWSHGIK